MPQRRVNRPGRGNKPASPKATSLPGGDVRAVGMSDYLIALKEQPSLSSASTRAEVFGDNLSRTSSFRRELESWLSQHDLAGEVAGIGEANGFPLLSLTCTATVAQAVAAFPDVEAVVADSDRSLGQIHEHGRP